MPAARACRKFLHPLFQTVQAAPFATLWQRTVILIENLKGGATPVQRGAVLDLGGAAFYAIGLTVKDRRRLNLRFSYCWSLCNLSADMECKSYTTTDWTVTAFKEVMQTLTKG